MNPCRSYSIPLKPTVRQQVLLNDLLRFQRELYNAALEERIGTWKTEQRSISRHDQYKELTGWDDERLKKFGVVVARGTLLRLDRSFKAFFHRVESGETPGFPRFKGANRFQSVEWPQQNGWKVVDTRLRIWGIGHIKFILNGRQLKRFQRATPKTMTIRKRGNRWEAIVVCQVELSQPRPKTGREIGLDVGIASFVTTSDGDQIENPRWYRTGQAGLSAKQRKRERLHRNSIRYRQLNREIAQAHRHIANQRKDFHHKLSRQLVNNYDLIAVEDLKISNMSKRPKPKKDEETNEYLPNGAAAKGGLNKSIHDAGWGNFTNMIKYKAEEAGAEMMFVNPLYTSQTCYECGHVAKENRISQAVFFCQKCDHKDNADRNAAKNILRLGQSQRDFQREVPSETAELRAA